MKGAPLITLLLGLFQLYGTVKAKGTLPNHGFFLIINSPLLGRHEENLYVYALHTSDFPSVDQVEFKKTGGLVSETVQTGALEDGSNYVGCFLYAGLPNRYRGTRYGTYEATYTSDDGSTTVMRSGYVKPPSDILDTRGVYTYTVWPAQSGESQLTPSPDNNIGVRWSSACRIIQWFKGKKRIANTGRRLTLTTTDDAGVYTLRRGKRGARGWFVQIEVIAASCQMDEYYSGGTCVSRSVTLCENGGVLRDADDTCTCPPFFESADCSVEVDVPNARDFILASVSSVDVRCGDLPGGNPKCRGYLFCFGDLYGCKCAPGWQGNNCDQACQKGKWGPGCSEICPDSDRDCDRIFGP